MPREYIATLYNHPIYRRSRIKLAEQVHDILQEEIHAGRWQVGDRLPSIADLTKITNLSPRTIMAAINELKREGYLAQKERRGTYLASMMPHDRKPFGTIGVVMLAEGASSLAFTGPRIDILHQVHMEATERNYLVEAHYFSDDSWHTPEGVRRFFGERAKAVIVPHGLPGVFRVPDDTDSTPLVFLSPESWGATPAVIGDLRLGAYELTQRVVRAGHTKILAFTHNPIPDQRFCFFDGIEHALQHAGLTFDRELAQSASSLANSADELGPDDLSSYIDLLRRAPETTAFIVDRLEQAHQLIDAGKTLGRCVPDDFSVVSCTADRLGPGVRSQFLSSLRDDNETIIKLVFDLIADILKNDTPPPASRLLVKPLHVEGHTLASPPGKKGHAVGKTV